jgi:hypothetical protein
MVDFAMTLSGWLILLASALAAAWWWLAHRPPSPSQLEPMSHAWLRAKERHRE